jgi:hypothetical protein
MQTTSTKHRGFASMNGDSSQAGFRDGFFARIPTSVFLVSVLAALLHMAPYWRAEMNAPAGWSFTGNLGRISDFLQYRVWFRQSQQVGPVINNKFTTEPNKPYIPVFFYYVVGKIARYTHSAPEFVYAYLGMPLAFVFTVLLFITVRHFLKSPYQVWWVFLAILAGGGLGAYIKLLSHFAAVHLTDNPLANRMLVEPLGFQWLFEDYRGHYVFLTLFDTHFLAVWTVATAALLSLYFTLREFSAVRLIVTGLLYAGMTLLHAYEGILLMMIAVTVGYLYWQKKLLDRFAMLTIAVCLISSSVCFVWLASLTRASGLPIPTWRAPTVFFSFLVIAYPLAWLLIARGLAEYWRDAGTRECFLLGWALGCTILTLAGPFYPYTPRGTMTLQIPLSIVAGAIYFSRHKRVARSAVLIAVLIMGILPVFALSKFWMHTRFDADAACVFTSDAHREMVELLRQHAANDDVLMAAEPDLLWLGPEYAGKFYCAHPVWTVDYELKRDRVSRFFSTDAEEQAAFLRQERIRFLYVDAHSEPKRLERIPGLVLLKTASIGSLFKYTPETPASFR